MTSFNNQLRSTQIPRLRFKEFSGKWENKELNEIANFIKGGGISKADVLVDGQNKCILYGELYTEYTEIISKIKSRTNISSKESLLSEKNDILIPSSGETALDIAKASCIKEENILLGGDLTVIKLKDQSGEFFAYYLSNYKNKDIAKLAQGNSVVHLYASHLKSLKVNIPSYSEQQKIADFLSSIDEWIENLRTQKKSLEDYKKGMMQKIFSQEIRIDNGTKNIFPKWIEMKLENIGKSYNGLSGKTGEDFGKGEPFITYKQIFDNSEIDIKKFAFVNVTNNEKQNRAQFGDIFFTTSSETPSEVGFSSVLLNKNIFPYLNSFSFGFRPFDLNILNPYFAKFLFRSYKFRRRLVKLAQGSTRYNISKIEFMKIRVLLPSYIEQQKIADFLTSLENLIESKQEQITEAEQWKKGLMQQLFV